jgi:hypothetical protein
MSENFLWPFFKRSLIFLEVNLGFQIHFVRHGLCKLLDIAEKRREVIEEKEATPKGLPLCYLYFFQNERQSSDPFTGKIENCIC